MKIVCGIRLHRPVNVHPTCHLSLPWSVDETFFGGTQLLFGPVVGGLNFKSRKSEKNEVKSGRLWFFSSFHLVQ